MDDQYRPSRFQILPPVVKNLLIINGLMFLASTVFESVLHIDLAQNLGLFYFGSTQFRPYQIITHLFMHGSFDHILSNMFMLWMFGNVLENYWGGKKFLTFYLITGIGAALIHSMVVFYEIHTLQAAVNVYSLNPSLNDFLLFIKTNVPDAYSSAFDRLGRAWTLNPNDVRYLYKSKELVQDWVTLKMNVPTIGASGAVFGVLIAFGMLFPNTIMYLIFFPIPIKAKYIVIMYALVELSLGIYNNPTDNVAHFAHLGGALFGFILIKLWYKPKRNEFY